MKSKGDNDYEATERSNCHGAKGFDDLDEAYGSADVGFSLREMKSGPMASSRASRMRPCGQSSVSTTAAAFTFWTTAARIYQALAQASGTLRLQGLQHHHLQCGTKAVSLQNHPMCCQAWGGDLSHHCWLGIINHGEAAAGSGKFRIMHAVRYDCGHIGNDTTGSTRMFAVSVRPSYQVAACPRTMAEAGAFWKKVENAKNGTGAGEQGQKHTMAYATAPSASLWARPEIRFSCSCLHSPSKDSISDTLYDGNSWNNGVNFGVQAEAWW